MAPETRSRGVPPPSRVFNSTPTLQQVQFPSRRKKIRRHAEPEHKTLKQQTLTQIDFVSSFDDDEDVIAMSESDDDIRRKSSPSSQAEDEDKENAPPANIITANQVAQSQGDEEEEIPVSRRRKRAGTLGKTASKRRRTMGDEGDQVRKASKRNDKSRRRTLGDVSPSTNYHTQTLTQFLGHQTSFIADSDDEQDERFLSWLGEPEPGSPSAGRGRRGILSSPACTATAEHELRENSVIPQTPAKRSTSIRFEISSGRLQSPSERMIGRYGAPDEQASPLRNRCSPMGSPRLGGDEDTSASSLKREPKPSLVIQDSYATEGWTTPSKSQSQARETPRGSPKASPILGTPSKLRYVVDGTSPTKAKTPKRKKTPSPKKMTKEGLYEIPDSDEDEDIGEEVEGERNPEEEVDDQSEEMGATACEARYEVGAETQAIMGEIASTNEDEAATKAGPLLPQPSSQVAKENNQISSPQTKFQAEQTAQGLQPTQENSSSNTSTTVVTAKPTRGRSIRKPLHHPSSHAQPSQPWESQRVPVSVLQSLPTPSARSDIILPISSAALESLITGHTTTITTSFKIPSQVVRFWLFENRLLRYMASVEPGKQQLRPQDTSSPTAWHFYATQVYELNNPVQEQDMLEEGWIEPQILRYSYLPPAVIGQLLWNLRHALFNDPSKPSTPPPQPSPVQDNNHLPRRVTTPPGSMTVSQQITAQIHSDIAYSTQLPTSDDFIPSTPDDNQALKIHPSSDRHDGHSLHRKSTIHPSQATTLSQASTPEKQSVSSEMPLKHNPPPPPLFNPSTESIQFIDTDSMGSLPFPSSLSSTSQLLTKSQLLPDSLIRDHAPPQPEIWDSDEEATSL